MAKINELMENMEFLEGLVKAKTPEELGKIFVTNGVELEEGMTLEDAFELIKKQESTELSEDDLADVNGGIALSVAVGAAGCLVLGAGAICFLGGYAYQKLTGR